MNSRCTESPLTEGGEMRVVWSGAAPSASLERLSLTIVGAVHASSVVEVGEERYEYEVRLNAAWIFEALQVSYRGGGELELRRDERGRWIENGTERPDLAGAIDIDLAFSPFTNTLPLRRLDLPVGAAAEILTAYVNATSLTVVPDPQRYTRLDVDRYLYESLDSDFVREITVDSDGLVVDYPGLFTRTGSHG